MKLSVIMSTYNNQATLQKAIDSVLSQSFKDFEFIIVNDGSVDATENVLKNNQDRDRRIVLIQQANAGLTGSLNAALSRAKGEYIARQDADDTSLPGRLEEQINFLDSNNEIGFIGCDCEVVDEHGEFMNVIRIKNDPRKNGADLRNNNIYCHGSMMFRKELMDKAGGYRDFFKYAQDYDLYLRLLEFTLPGSVNKTLYRRRIGLDGISIQKIHLQAAYSNLAKKCCEIRRLNQNDNLLLTEAYLKKMEIPDHYDYMLLFMQSLNYVKYDEINKARALMRPCLSPADLKKYKLYLLWLLSYFPKQLRKSVLALKSNYRRSKLIMK